MADITLHELFGNVTVTGVISRIATPLSRFQRFWGMQVGGTSTNTVGGKLFMWDTFDRSRDIAVARGEDIGPANVPLHRIGAVQAAAMRIHEKVRLSEARLHLTRPPGGQFGLSTVDRRGQAYAARQMQTMGQRFLNAREFMVSRMMKGEFGVKQEGETWYLVDSIGGTAPTDFTWKVDFQIPDAQKNAAIGALTGVDAAASWATNTTNIFGQVTALNALYEEWHGYPLRHIWLNNNTLQYVMNNDTMKSVAGTANRVFTTYQPDVGISAEGIPSTGHDIVFEAIPWITWHCYDGGLNVGRVNSGTFTKFVEDDRIICTPDPSPDIAEWTEGSEVVAENVMDVGTERFGFYSWSTRVIDAAGFELKGIDVGLPALYVPRTISFLDVTG